MGLATKRIYSRFCASISRQSALVFFEYFFGDFVPSLFIPQLPGQPPLKFCTIPFHPPIARPTSIEVNGSFEEEAEHHLVIFGLRQFEAKNSTYIYMISLESIFGKTRGSLEKHLWKIASLDHQEGSDEIFGNTFETVKKNTRSIQSHNCL